MNVLGKIFVNQVSFLALYAEVNKFYIVILIDPIIIEF